MFLRENGGIEKNWNSFAVAPLPLFISLPPKFQQLLNPHLLTFFKKSYPPIQKERRRHRQQSIVLCPEFFCKYWYMYIYCIVCPLPPPPPLCLYWGRVAERPTKFSKREAWQDLNF